MIAVDTSVIVDLLGEDSHADAAEVCLRDAMSRGPVVACEIVVSEVVAGFGHSSQLIDTLDEMGLGFSALELRSATRAGEMQRRYNVGSRRRADGPLRRARCPTFSSARTHCSSARR